MAKLSRKGKRIRQKVMHRVTRAVHANSVLRPNVEHEKAWKVMQPIVHEAVTTALEEETSDAD